LLDPITPKPSATFSSFSTSSPSSSSSSGGPPYLRWTLEEKNILSIAADQKEENLKKIIDSFRAIGSVRSDSAIEAHYKIEKRNRRYSKQQQQTVVSNNSRRRLQNHQTRLQNHHQPPLSSFTSPESSASFTTPELTAASTLLTLLQNQSPLLNQPPLLSTKTIRKIIDDMDQIEGSNLNISIKQELIDTKMMDLKKYLTN
jgi:hypothetical protein